MHKARVAYTYLRFLISKATKIQKAFRLYILQKETKERVEVQNTNNMFVWRKMMEEFK